MDKRIIVVSLLLAACAAPPSTSTPTDTIASTDTNTATPLPPTETATTTPAPTAVPLPDLPEEFLAKFPEDESYIIEDGKVVVDQEVWYVFEDGQWAEKLWVYDSLTSEEIAAIEFEGSEDSWGVQYERLAGQDPEKSSYVVGIRGKVVSIYRKDVDGHIFVMADMATQIEGEKKVLSLMLGDLEDDGGSFDVILNFRDDSSKTTRQAQGVVDNVKLSDVVTVEVVSNITKSRIDFLQSNPDYEPQAGASWMRKYMYENYEVYESLLKKIAEGTMSSVTIEEAQLFLKVFMMTVE